MFKKKKKLRTEKENEAQQQRGPKVMQVAGIKKKEKKKQVRGA